MKRPCQHCGKLTSSLYRTCAAPECQRKTWGDPIYVVPGKVWDAVCVLPSAEGSICKAAETGGSSAVDRCVRSLLARINREDLCSLLPEARP